VTDVDGWPLSLDACPIWSYGASRAFCAVYPHHFSAASAQTGQTKPSPVSKQGV
jgi:hypothetical protein